MVVSPSLSKTSMMPKRGTRMAESPMTKVSMKTRGDCLSNFFIMELRAIRPSSEAKAHQKPIHKPY